VTAEQNLGVKIHSLHNKRFRKQRKIGVLPREMWGRAKNGTKMEFSMFCPPEKWG